MTYLTQEQWKQVQNNIEEGQKQSKRIIIELELDDVPEKFYIDYVEYEEVGLVPITACLIGTYNELLYNYYGDEVTEILYLDEEENNQYREIIVLALIENNQVLVRFFNVGEYEESGVIEVAILEHPPEKYVVELLYKNGKYEVKV